MRRALLLLSLLASGGHCCHLFGVDSGVCREQEDFAADMPFCSGVVRYTACVPRYQPWFPNHTLLAKDAWVENTYHSVVQRRIAVESGSVRARDGEPWEGIGADVVQRFKSNDDCMSAYRNFVCWLNFPRCDEQQASMLLCRSVCENFVRACKYSADMSRCYNYENFGGKEVEPDTLVDDQGLPIYLRAWFPGQPFHDNQFGSGESVLPVCTPSIPGGAAGSAAGWAALLVPAAAAAVLAAAAVYVHA